MYMSNFNKLGYQDLYHRYDMYCEDGRFVDPIVIPSIVAEELKLSMTYNEIVEYVCNAAVNITKEDISEYFEDNIKSEELPIELFNKIKSLEETLIPPALKFHEIHINMLKRECIILFSLINKINENKLNKEEVLENNETLKSLLKIFGIEINKNGDISYKDLIKLLTLVIQKVIDLVEKVYTVNDLDMYLNGVHSISSYITCVSEYQDENTVNLIKNK